VKKTRYSESQIIKVLNEVEGGRTVNAVCRKYGIAEATYYTLSKKHPRSGYRFIPQLLCSKGWTVNRKRIQRVRRQEGLGVWPVSKGKRRPRVSMGYPVQAAYPGHVWSRDFIMDRTTDGRAVIFRIGVIPPTPKRCILSRAVPGKTDLLKVSIAGFETSVLTQKPSFPLPKPASSSKTIDAFIMEKGPIVVWAIKHPDEFAKNLTTQPANTRRTSHPN
jgi:hypothetical protein